MSTSRFENRPVLNWLLNSPRSEAWFIGMMILLLDGLLLLFTEREFSGVWAVVIPSVVVPALRSLQLTFTKKKTE